MLTDVLKGMAGVLAGGVIGAYLSTSAIRWGRDEGASLGRSRCDACHKSLGWHETIPVVSFLCFGGRCATCRAPIERLHLAGELGGALLLGTIFALRPWPMAGLEALGAMLLLWLALIDLKTFTLPNVLVLVLAMAGGIYAALAGALGFNSLVALSVGALLSLLAYGLYRLKGQTALGVGDIKLIGALSLWLGERIIYVMILGSLIGVAHIALVRKPASEPSRIAFGPALAASAMLIATLAPYAGGLFYG